MSALPVDNGDHRILFKFACEVNFVLEAEYSIVTHAFGAHPGRNLARPLVSNLVQVNLKQSAVTHARWAHP
jgi:hypothetical protein